MTFRLLIAAALAAGTALAIAQTPQPQPQPRPAAPTPPLTAPSVPGAAHILMDFETGQVLAGDNIHEGLQPASITKVMTAYVVSAEIAAGRISLDDEVFISENAWRQGGAATDGSFSALAVNSRVALRDVLKGMMVQSGNDASIALAEHVAGTEEAFVDLMNRTAAGLGMRNSHFRNSHGLTAEGQMMSVYDIALLASAMIRDFPEQYAYYSVREFTFNEIRQYNRNGLLWRDESVDGLKTGYTAAAGFCLVTSAERSGQRLIAAVLGIQASRNEGFRLREEANQTLLNWGFRNFETHEVYPAGSAVATHKVYKGAEPEIGLGLAQPLRVTVPRGRYEELRAEMDVPAQLVAPIDAGQAIGSLRLSLDGETVVERDLVALGEVPQGGFFRRLADDFWLWWDRD
ncbi:MAG: D-alanyl-D-alanine carboxypeptidase family protein [Lysobacteraceae bacterium]